MKEISDMDTLKDALRHLRKKAGLSQSELAQLAGLSRTAIQALEDGKPTCKLSTFFKVTHVLNLKLYADHPLLPWEITP
ncbi:MAG: helix-turn-helix domain-containing protein [Proteobacteria bacterium]|nr:helix-turn-helix domain-containing protein [Pseudomonadota bacterium]